MLQGIENLPEPVTFTQLKSEMIKTKIFGIDKSKFIMNNYHS